MQPRRIARELAFLCLTQLTNPSNRSSERKGANTGRGGMGLLEGPTQAQDTLLVAVRFLKDECEEALKHATATLQQSNEQLFQSDIGARDVVSAREKVQQAVGSTEQAINILGAVLDLPERILLADHPEVRQFTLELVQTYLQQQERVDAVIKNAIVGWQWERLGRIEQEILHLSVTELIALPQIPAKVSISEAVELAKRYGGEQTPSFVNGVLRKVLDSLRTEQPS